MTERSSSRELVEVGMEGEVVRGSSVKMAGAGRFDSAVAIEQQTVPQVK